jgi:threonine dehydrogenase-like Zn-dependent dehydrogenase
LRAYVMSEPGRLTLEEVPDPVCQPDEVITSTEAVSICSTDISYYRGSLVPPSWPIVPGHEYVGRIVEVGARHRQELRAGDRLCFWGQTDFHGLAEYRAWRPLLAETGNAETIWYTDRGFCDADQAAAVVVPEGLRPDVATIVEPLTSVLRSLLVNPPGPGDRCVVLGCGPSAQLAIQVLTRLLAVESVLAVDINDQRLGLACDSGASLCFNVATQSEQLRRCIHDHRGQYADYVFDALPNVLAEGPGRDVRDLAMELLRPGGLYVIYGVPGVRQHINTWLPLAKGLRLRAAAFDVRSFPMRHSSHIIKVALRLIESCLVDARCVVSARVSFYDEALVRRTFDEYGVATSMKTSILVAGERGRR